MHSDKQPGAAFEQYTAEWEWSHEVRELHEAYRAACDAWDTLERISRKVARDNHEDYTNEQRLRINELELQAWRLRQGLESIGHEAVASWEAERDAAEAEQHAAENLARSGYDAESKQQREAHETALLRDEDAARAAELDDGDGGRDWEGEAQALKEAQRDAAEPPEWPGYESEY